MKNFKKKIILSALTLSFLCACSNDVESTIFSDSSNANQSNLISVDNALKISNERMRDDMYASTRSNRQVASIEFLGNTKLTRDDSMYGFYVINYEDDAGFTIISADDRRPEKLIAISDKGNLLLSDTLENENLSWYLNSYAPNIGNFNPPVYDLDTIPFDLQGNRHYRRPLLNDVVANMHQGKPYNNNCPEKDGVHAWVGCVPLAIGQVMGYYKWPESAQGVDYNWDEMVSDTNHPSWPILFERLGRRENCWVTYGWGENSTGAICTNNNLSRTFNNYGYSSTTFVPFSLSNAKEILTQSIPMLIEGPLSTGGKSHLFIIDGGYTHRILGLEQTSYSEYLHCLWGGSGGPKLNGYFLFEDGRLQDDAFWQPREIYYGAMPIK